MNHRILFSCATLAALLGLVGPAHAAAPTGTTPRSENTATAPGDSGVRRDVPAALAKKAKITLDSARTTALAKVPGGKVLSEELENEQGKLIYSFDIKLPGKPGIEEVNVDAISGKVINQHHESAKAEKAEEKKEGKPAPPHGGDR